MCSIMAEDAETLRRECTGVALGGAALIVRFQKGFAALQQSLSTEPLPERKHMKIEAGTYKTTIKYNSEWNEYIVRLYNKQNESKMLASYHTDDKDDAIGTANKMLSEALMLGWREGKTQPSLS